MNSAEYVIGGPHYPITADISVEALLKIPGYHRAVTLKSGIIAPLSADLLNDDKTEDRSHVAYGIVNRRPNGYMGPTKIRETWLLHKYAYGNGYQRIWRKGGKPVSTTLLMPSIVRPFLVDDEKWFYLTDTKEVLANDEVMHIMGPSHDGIVGVRTAQLLSSTFESAAVLQKYTLKYFQNGAFINGVIQCPAGMKQEDFVAMVTQWGKRHGIDTAGKTGFLLNGAQYINTTADNKQTDLAAVRQATNADIGRVTGVDPALLFESSGSGQDQDKLYRTLVKDGLRSDIEQIEDEYAKLLTPSERAAGKHWKLDTNEILRGDPARQANLISGYVSGVFKRDEVRGELDYGPTEGGDVLLVPHSQAVPQSAGTSGAEQPEQPAAVAPVAPVATQETAAPADTATATADVKALPNGAQGASMLDVVTSVASGAIPRDTGVNLLVVLAGISADEADRIIGSAGQGTSTTPNVNPAAAEAPAAPAAADAPAVDPVQQDEQPQDYAKLLPLVQQVADTVQTKQRKMFEAKRGKPGFSEWVIEFGNKQGAYLAKESSPLAQVTGTDFTSVIRAYEESVISEQPYELAQELFNAIQSK